MDPVSRLSRKEKLLGGLDIRNSKGLEIGALNAPLIRPADANIRFVDYADRPALQARYAGDPNVKPDDIVPVDAIWGEKTLSACFPGESFDFVIASHVAEHVPDLIGWLSEIADIVRPGGRLILALPDRRYSFDVLRRETSLSEVIDNHLRRVRRPTPGQVFDSCANTVDFNHVNAWFSPDEKAYKPFVSRDYALCQAVRSRNGDYIDAHCSVFTARSLLQLLADLLELKFLHFRVKSFHVAEKGTGEMSLILEPLGKHGDHDLVAARSSIGALLEAGVDSEGLPLDSVLPARGVPKVGADAEIVALRRALDVMRASTSWRVTAPMRALGNRVQAYRRFLASRVSA